MIVAVSFIDVYDNTSILDTRSKSGSCWKQVLIIPLVTTVIPHSFEFSSGRSIAKFIEFIKRFLLREGVFHYRIDIENYSFSSNSKVELSLLTRITAHQCENGTSQNYGTLLSSSISRIKIDGKGLRVSRDNLAYSEYGIRLMLAPRSAKALQEKVLSKLHGIRKLPGSLSLGGTLFWIIAELHRA
ncbi:hypothetical protein Tco_0584216 [Tanacetum coccineum]